LVWFRGLSAEEWTVRYEAVRRQAIEERHSLENGWELALLVRRGVMAWMRAWPTMDEPTTLHGPVDARTDEPQALPITIPSSVRDEMTSVLVSMILPQRSAPLAAVS
jgi:hypothetical protein